jgi:hypothetical protein
MRPGAWKKVLSKVRRPWRIASSLIPSENAIAAANIAFCTLCRARPSSVAGIRCVHSSGMWLPLSYSVIIWPLTPASSAQARPPARMCSRTRPCCGFIVT